MKLKATLFCLFAVVISLCAQQPVLNTYITDAGDTISYSNTNRQNPFPPPSPQSCASSNNLPLPYNTNNAQRGVMFDITALNNITINCFEVNLAAGTTGVEIYYKIGTHVGFTVTPGAWTLLGNVNVASAGVNVPTAIPIPVNVAVQAGCTVAFYITRTQANGPSVSYTNGTAVGFVFGSNADMQVKDGTGKDYPFGANFTPRRFNGTIFYTLNSSSSTGVVNGPLSVCAGSTQTYTYSGTGWTTYTWTVPSGTLITSGQGTNTITITAGSTPGQICCTPSGACGPGPVACLSVTLAPVPTATTSVVNVTCFGANNGSATVTPSPAGTYTYTWSPNVSTTQTASSLAPGSYTVTVTNSGGCFVTQTVTITQPPVLSAQQSHVNVLCSGANTGSATVTPAGGTPNYSYAWAPSGGNAATASSLAAGTYTCTITDANGCTNAQTITITSPPAITLATSSTPSICGNPNGSASVVATGGTGSYTYAWSPSGGTAATETGLLGGAYVVTVTDGNLCTATATVNVVGASTPTITITGSTNILCNGGTNGSATAVAAGGNSPYTYAWSPSGGNAATAANLSAGTYTITLTDANGCTATASITLTQPPVLSAQQSHVNVLCNGANTGSATVTPAGGTPNYSYAWSPSGGNAATASSLAAGTYTCTITDANGCTNAQTITITSPPAITLATSSTPSICGNPNGSASVVANGGTGNYTYAWSPSGGTAATETGLVGGAYVVTVTDGNSCTATATVNVTGASVLTITITSSTNILCNGGTNGSATAVAAGGNGPYTYAWSPSGGTAATESNLAAGAYTVTLTDASGCTATDSVTLTEPPLLTSTISYTDVLCNGGTSGTATMNAAGGNPAYNYAWTPSGGNAATATGLSAQSYTCTVTDANGCTTTSSVTLTEPTALTTTASQVDELCNGGNNGSGTVNPSGGVPAYSYVWSPSGGNSASAPALYAGNYTVTITDANGCTLTQSFTITQPPALVASQSAVTHVDCFGQSTGAASVTQSGGTGPYTYVWSPNVSTTNSAASLPAAAYQVTVTDANGCASTITITVTEPPLLTLQTVAAPSVICNGQQVALTATPAGGVPAYAVVWNPGNMTGNTQTVSPSATTTYSATVTDVNGCTANATATVTVNPVPVAAFSGDVLAGCAPVCVNFSDLSTIAAPGIIVAWDWDFGDGNNSTLQNPNHCYTTSGIYTVVLIARSADGCSHTATLANYVNVYVNPVAAFSASPQPTTVLTPQIYFTDLSSNATAWTWSFGDVSNSSSTLQNPNFTYFAPECYRVLLSVTTANGCADTISHPVCLGPDVSIYVPNAFTPNGDGINEVFIPVTTGIDPAKYVLWIFDRWGNVIFTTTDMMQGWNGKVKNTLDLCQVDTYVWRIVATDENGSLHTELGAVNLVR